LLVLRRERDSFPRKHEEGAKNEIKKTSSNEKETRKKQKK